VLQRKRAETACEPGAEDDPDRRPACSLEPERRTQFQTDAKLGLLKVGRIFFDECEKQADALRAAIARDQAIWGAIAGGAANVILALLSGGVAAAGAGMAPAGSAIGAGATAGAGGFAEARTVAIAISEATKASTPVVASEFGTALRELGGKVANDIRKEAMRGMTRSAGRSAHDGRSGDERQKTIDSLGLLAQSFLSQLDSVAHQVGGLTDEQLIELKNAVLDTSTAQQESARFVAGFVADFRQTLEPIGTEDHGSNLGRAPNRYLPGIVHHRAIFIRGLDEQKRLALVRHVTDAFPAVRQAGRAAVDGIVRGVDEVTEGDTYDDQAWKEYREDPGDEFHFERWIKSEHFEEIAGRGAPTIPVSRVQGVTFVDMLGATE
jgi:hypothetical protein